MNMIAKVLRRILPCACLLAAAPFTASGSGATSEPEQATRGSAAVTLVEDEASYTLANGIVSARIEKRTGNLASLQYRGLDLLKQGRGYWSFVGSANTLGKAAPVVRTDPAANGGTRGEVSCRFSYDPKTTALPADVDIRYALGQGDQGLYVYSVWHHPEGYPPFALAEARYAVKLNPQIFDFMTIDAKRRKVMPSGEDWDKGTPLQLKEVRQMTTGLYAGQPEHKYDYSAMLSEVPAYGWSSTQQKVGLWIVNPSMEYLAGGPTKVELTGHRDVNSGGAPTLLNMWLGSHYGGSSLAVAREESWTKVVGPFLLYCNSANGHEEMWRDALSRAASDAKAWPFAWASDPTYPSAAERARVSGTITVRDLLADDTSVKNLHVGLTAPDYVAPRAKNPSSTVEWQREGKYYQFWSAADAQGRFTIEHVRPGKYTLHAFSESVLGEYSKADIIVGTGEELDLGKLTWTPVRYGRTVWEIGVPDRSAAEFRHGDDYWHWGLFQKYPQEFPNDVNFVIGKSNPRTDWNYVQPGRPAGAAQASPTTWSITFDIPQPMRGEAALRLGIAGSRTERGLEVLVNDVPAGVTGPLPDTGVMHRDGIRGYWCERTIRFDASLLKSGQNVIKLRLPARGWVEGVLYDYVRLEVREDT